MMEELEVAPVVVTGMAAVSDPLLLIVAPFSTTEPTPPLPVRATEPPELIVVVPAIVVVPVAVSDTVPDTLMALKEYEPAPCSASVRPLLTVVVPLIVTVGVNVEVLIVRF